jgi:hypothetical protein
MNEDSYRVAASLTRRTFLRVIGATGAALVVPVGMLLSQGARTGRHSGPIVSFHMDQPYLDTSGTALPYDPPRGMRSGAPVAHLSEEAFRSSHCYV